MMKRVFKDLCKLFLCALLWCFTFGGSFLWRILFQPYPHVDVFVYVLVILVSIVPTVLLLRRNSLAWLFAPVQFGVMYLIHTEHEAIMTSRTIVEAIFDADLFSAFRNQNALQDAIYIAILTAEICAWVGLSIGVYWFGRWISRRFKQHEHS